SADVAGSTKTNIAGEPIFSFEHPESRDIHWGIREFAMCACQNGILLHGGLSTYIATFFVFSDYMKGALRLAALQQLPAVYLFTHDSLAVGEDGATHQPIEQLAMLRAMPGIDVIRPADARESEGALRYAFAKKKGPTAVILTRQDVPTLEKSDGEMVKKGAYCVYAPEEKAEAMILATGSEVALAIDAAKLLKEKGIAVKVVSFPCFECYEALKPEEKAEILDLPYEKRVSLEMLSTFGWAKYAPHNIGIDTFGASGKDKDVLAHFGFTKEAVAEKVASFLSGK
ncbi:MAG: transketolase, partial [Bacilli bacterium]|nr:transketolase [Bacilli bacterium]